MDLRLRPRSRKYILSRTLPNNNWRAACSPTRRISTRHWQPRKACNKRSLRTPVWTTQPRPFRTLATISPNFLPKAWNSSKKGSISLQVKCGSRRTPMSICCDKAASCLLRQTVDHIIRTCSRHRINCNNSSKICWMIKGSSLRTSGVVSRWEAASPKTTMMRSSITLISTICAESSQVLISLTSIARTPRCQSSLSSLSRWTRALSAGWWSRMRKRTQVTIQLAAAASRKVEETLVTIQLNL